MSITPPIIATGIICSEYRHETNQFIFVSKNDDIASSDDYHLNIYNNANKTMLRPVPLTGIKNYPNATNVHFGGLCSYADTQSSFYMNFEETTTTNSTITLIYQLQLNSTTSTPVQFQKTALELFDTTLSSFHYAVDNNNTSVLAYIATSKTHQNSLNLISLDSPQHHSTKNISTLGLLAVGGTKSQSLYFFQDNAVDLYKLDTLQYSHNIIQTNMTLEGLRRGTTGHVFSNNNFTKEYISFYHSNSGQMDIFDVDISLVKYVPATTTNGYIDLNTNATVTLEKPAPTPVSQTSKRSLDTAEETNRPFLKALSKRFYLKRGIADNSLQKRAIETSNTTTRLSSDGTINYHTAQIVPDNEKRMPQAAILVPTSTGDGNYEYALFSDSADPNTFTITTETSQSQTPLAATPTVYAEDASSTSNLGGGAIAGIVISVIVFVAIIAGLLLYSKKRKEKVYTMNSRSMKPEMASYDSSTPLSIQPEDFISARYSGGVTVTRVDDNHTHTSSILQATAFIPEEYHDGTRPDIRPLSYNEGTIDYAQLSPEELLQLEPDVLGPLFLFSGEYTSSEDEQVTYIQDGYAIRTFNANDGLKHTVHYFSASHLDTFVRSVHAVLRTSPSSRSNRSRSSLVAPSYIIKSERAIILSSPTPHNHYQYIWITSPMIPEHSLQHLLFEQTRWTFIDHRNTDYKIWSIYSILKCVETMHSHKFVHLAIDPKAFYFDHEMKATDWRLGNLGYARSKSKPRTDLVFPPCNQFSAPEIIQGKDKLQLESADMWSLGCVIYTVATGGLLLFEDASEVRSLTVFHDDMKQFLKIKIRQNVESQVFQTVLEKMLQVDPSERKSIKNVLDYWNSIYNMEE